MGREDLNGHKMFQDEVFFRLFQILQQKVKDTFVDIPILGGIKHMSPIRSNWFIAKDFE